MNIPEPPNVFFVKASKLGNKAIVEVVCLSGGSWRSREFTVQPGDTVGAVGDDGVDYRTGITVVDILFDQATQAPGATTDRLLYVSDKSERLMDRTIEADGKAREKFMNGE